jgi:hypothetical protein
MKLEGQQYVFSPTRAMRLLLMRAIARDFRCELKTDSELGIRSQTENSRRVDEMEILRNASLQS